MEDRTVTSQGHLLNLVGTYEEVYTMIRRIAQVSAGLLPMALREEAEALVFARLADALPIVRCDEGSYAVSFPGTLPPDVAESILFTAQYGERYVTLATDTPPWFPTAHHEQWVIDYVTGAVADTNRATPQHSEPDVIPSAGEHRRYAYDAETRRRIAPASTDLAVVSYRTENLPTGICRATIGSDGVARPWDPDVDKLTLGVMVYVICDETEIALPEDRRFARGKNF